MQETNKLKQLSADDPAVDSILRPSSWQDYVGQDKVKRNLKIILEAAMKRKESCDHLLFYGQAGLVKTTLAYLVAKELNSNLKVTSGPALEKAGDLAAVLSNLEKNDVLFIGKGPAARTVTLDLPPFTLVAATTRINLLSGPLRSRFGATFKLDYYDFKSIEEILKRSSKILRIDVDEGAIGVIAKASRFTPRVANRLLKRVRDFAQVSSVEKIDSEIAKKTMELLEIDNLGLETYDRRLLEVLIQKFHGGPAGVGSLAAALNEDKGNIEDVYEPYLMNIGLLMRTPLGRVVTRSAYEHLGFKPPEESSLF